MKSFNFIFFLKEGEGKKEIGRKEETFKKNFGFSEADYILKEFLSEYYKKEVKNSGLKHVFTGDTYSSFKKDGDAFIDEAKWQADHAPLPEDTD